MTVTAVATALAAPSASAGEWVRATCQTLSGATASSAGWSNAATNGGDGSNAVPYCGANTPMYAELSSGETPPVGADESLIYTPPAGSTLTGGQISLEMGAIGGGANGGGGTSTATIYTPNYAYDSADVVLNCANPSGPCDGTTTQSYPHFDYGGTAGSVFILPSGRGGTVTIGADCRGGTPGSSVCNPGPGNMMCTIPATPQCARDTKYISFADVNWANLQLTNNSIPSGADFSGTLLGTASSPTHGTATLSFSAGDPNGPGVYSVQVVAVDGSTRTVLYSGTPTTTGDSANSCVSEGADPQGSGAMVFASQQPCPQSETVNTSEDTTQLSDGPHQIEVLVEDAAENSSIVLDTQITVKNQTTASSDGTESPGSPSTGPTGTTGSTGASGGAGGNGGSGGTTPTTVVVPVTVKTAAPSRASLSTDTFVLSHATYLLQRRTIHRLWSRSRLTLSGTVVSPAGTPQANAPVIVTSTLLTGGHAKIVARARSNGAGLFKLRIARGNSRALRMTVGRGVITLHELVTPNLTLHTRLVGHRLLLTGRIRVSKTGSRPLLLIQDDNPAHGWQNLGPEIHPDRTGRYSYAYPVNARVRGTFLFRIHTLATPTWQATSSPARKVVVP